MISSTFYNRANLVREFFGGRASHFPSKDPSVTIEWKKYILKQGETLYVIAEKIFGEGLGYMWTYIADNNALRHPDSWEAGDIIKLPKIVVRDSDTDSTLRKR